MLSPAITIFEPARQAIASLQSARCPFMFWVCAGILLPRGGGGDPSDVNVLLFVMCVAAFTACRDAHTFGICASAPRTPCLLSDLSSNAHLQPPSPNLPLPRALAKAIGSWSTLLVVAVARCTCSSPPAVSKVLAGVVVGLEVQVLTQLAPGVEAAPKVRCAAGLPAFRRAVAPRRLGGSAGRRLGMGLHKGPWQCAARMSDLAPALKRFYRMQCQNAFPLSS